MIKIKTFKSSCSQEKNICIAKMSAYCMAHHYIENNFIPEYEIKERSWFTAQNNVYNVELTLTFNVGSDWNEKVY